MLDLAPETERHLHDFATREGIDANEAINRLLRANAVHPPSRPAVPADDPVLQFLQAQLREAEGATPLEQAEAAWRAFAHAMNENRRQNLSP